jgi:cytochrome c5
LVAIGVAPRTAAARLKIDPGYARMKSLPPPIWLQADSHIGGQFMNHVKAIRSLTVLALILLVQGCGKEAVPPAATPVTPPPAAVGSTGAQAPNDDVYKKTCAACHGQGLAGAPKLGDKAAWEPRINQGLDALYAVALKGKPGTAMAAKGGNASLTDADVKAAVDYMVSKAR